MKKYIFALLLITFSGSFLFSQENGSSEELSVKKIWKEYQFYPKRIIGFRSMNDGEHYTRFEDKGGEKSIVRHSFKNINDDGEIILDGKNLTYNGKKLSVDSYQFNEDETKVLLLVNRIQKYRRSFYATYYLYDLKTNKLEPLDEQHEPQTLASYSPDGKKVAYIYANNLYVKNLSTGKIEAITTDGKKNAIINGTTDWVYEEEFAITKAYDWSPNSQYIAYLRFDESKVKDYTMMYYLKNNPYPQPYTFKYPKAGEDNSKVTFHVMDLKSKKSTPINLGDYEYIPRLQFSKVENKVMALTLNRHQDHIKYHWIDVSKKKMKDHIVYEESDKDYLSIDDNLYFLKDGKHFIRTSEKDGYNHIYLIGIDGSVQQITHGKWDVIDFKGINEKKGIVYYTSAEDGPQYQMLYSIHLDGTHKKEISKKLGINDPTFSKGMKYFVNEWSNINTPPVYSLNMPNGKLIKVMEDNASLKKKLKAYNFQPKHFITVQGATLPLNAWILYPPHFDSTKHYPVYFNIYGGPGNNTVLDSYDGGNGAYHQLLAQHGYIVISVDPRGTMFRGAKFKRLTYLQLGKLETQDFVAVAHDLAKKRYVDSSRIGIMGWSYGGFMTLNCMTQGAPTFKMGIAVAPVSNWRYYDNIYTERFMRTPQENAAGYDDNSPINHADELQGKLLIIHGTGDDNVHLQNTIMMVNQLIAANKDFSTFFYPNRNHGIYGGNTRNHLYRMMFNFTLKNL